MIRLTVAVIMCLAGLALPGGRLHSQPAPAQAVADEAPPAEFEAAVQRFRDRAEEKIFGGTLAAPGEFPWQVSLGVSWIASPAMAHYCGGTIYNSGWVVTAGHCVAGLTADQITVTYGTNVLTGAVSRLNVARIIRHPQYRKYPTHIQNDVALLKLRDPLEMGRGVEALPLLEAVEDARLQHNSTELVVTGWGRTTIGGGNVTDLRKVTVKYMDNARCSSPLSYGPVIDGGMLCAGVDAGGMDSCKGDSGGPLIWRVPSGSPRLAGIVSFGEGCAIALKWGVYARAAHYRDWIVQNAS